MEKKAKIGEEVIILDVPWQEDRKFIGHVVKLDKRETTSEWATAIVNDRMVVISKYVKATKLNKELF